MMVKGLIVGTVIAYVHILHGTYSFVLYNMNNSHKTLWHISVYCCTHLWCVLVEVFQCTSFLFFQKKNKTWNSVTINTNQDGRQGQVDFWKQTKGEILRKKHDKWKWNIKTCVLLISHSTILRLYSIWGLVPVLLHLWSSARDQTDVNWWQYWTSCEVSACILMQDE
jgi:hypothetical protein